VSLIINLASEEATVTVIHKICFGRNEW